MGRKMTELTLFWVDKIREMYDKCVAPSDALSQLFDFGEQEEAKLSVRLNEMKEETDLFVKYHEESMKRIEETFKDIPRTPTYNFSNEVHI